MKPTVIVLLVSVLLSVTGCTAPIPLITPAVPEGNADPVTITVENAPTVIEQAEFSAGEMGPVTALAFTRADAQLRVVHTRTTPMLRHWEVSSGNLLAEYDLETVGLGAAVFDRTARLLALSGVANLEGLSDDYMRGTQAPKILGPLDGIEIIDAESGELLNHLSDPEYPQADFHGVAFSADGRIVASQAITFQGQLSVILDQEPGLCVFQIPPAGSGTAAPLFATASSYSSVFEPAFALGAEGRLLAIYARHGFIQLWDLEAQREWGELELNLNPADPDSADYGVSRMAIAPTRQWLAAFSAGEGWNSYRQITLWRLDERQVQWQAELAGYVNAFAFNPSGTLLAAGSSAGVRVWSTETGAEVKVFPGDAVYAVAFSQDGSRLAWGDQGGIVHLVGLPED